MGTIWSRTEQPVGNTTEQECPATNQNDDNGVRKKEMEEDMRKFRAELATKREARKEAIAALNKKITELKEEVDKERKERERLASLLEAGGGSQAEVGGLEHQVRALKDVASIGGEMLRIRELQVNELREKIQAIEETGAAYEKEVENIRRLKCLYEERSRAMQISHQMEVEREKARVVAAETKLEIAEEKNRELLEAKKELEERVTALDSTVDKNNNEISDLRIQLAGKKGELYNVTSQMTIVNNLFSQVLSDPESLDRVNRVLEEHHNLVNHLTEKGKMNDVASVLMTVADKDHVLTEEEQDIASNLSKVWRLLVELLGHHNKHTPEDTMPDSCYKSVDTPSGPKLVISVSKTFLRLKDLILEKNCLVKEVGRMKDLNCHLEKRLVSQETRLAEVAEELHKTWAVVNKLRTQHKALHTHEQVLRYELKHKRLMLNELKQQLEDCREMWQMARVKNSQTEKDWIILRKEFADRKQQMSNAESGYEESPGDSQDEEDSHKLSDEETDSPEEPASVSEAVEEPVTPGCISDRLNIPDGDIITTLVGETTRPLEVSDSCDGRNSSVQESSTSPVLEVCVEDVVLINEEPYVPSNCSDVANGMTALPPSLSEGPDDLTVEMPSPIHILPWEESASSTSNSENVLEIETVSSEAACSNQAVKCQVVQETTQQTVPEETKEPSEASSSGETNGTTPQEHKKTTAEEILERREARLQRLEEQCKSLFCKMNNTNIRSEQISNKLVELHEHFGEVRNETQEASSEENKVEAHPAETIQEHPSEEQRVQCQSFQEEEAQGVSCENVEVQNLSSESNEEQVHPCEENKNNNPLSHVVSHVGPESANQHQGPAVFNDDEVTFDLPRNDEEVTFDLPRNDGAGDIN